MLFFILFILIESKKVDFNDIIIFEDKVFRNKSILYYYYEKEPIKCLNSSQCQLDWCSSGSKCSNEGYCLTLMDYPCLHTTRCISKKKNCEPITCFTKNECDDKIYCNGYEECDNRICKGSKYPCLKGKICNEKNSSCSVIEKVSKFVHYSGYHTEHVSVEKGDYNIKVTNGTLWDSNSLAFQVTILVLFIVMGICILGLCLLPICRPSKRTRYY